MGVAVLCGRGKDKVASLSAIPLLGVGGFVGLNPMGGAGALKKAEVST